MKKKKKIIVRATLDLGDYLFTCMKPAIEELKYVPVKVPSMEDKIYLVRHMPDPARKKAMAQEQALLAKETQDPDSIACYIWFTDWAFRWGHVRKNVALPVKKVFWSREDPFHFDQFLDEAKLADFICTSGKESMSRYNEKFPTKPVLVTPMALAPDVFFPPETDDEREWDIVFVGNRYMGRKTRESGENIVLLPAIRWAKKNKKQFGLWGKGPGSPDLFNWANQREVWAAKIFQKETLRLGSAGIYRKAKVVLSYSSCPTSATMLPNRVLQAAGSGCILISQKTPATDFIVGADNYVGVSSPQETDQALTKIFNALPEHFAMAKRAREQVLNHHTFKHRLIAILEMIGEKK